MSDTSIPLLNVSGTPSAIGEAHGERFRDLVQEHVAVHRDWIFENTAVPMDAESLDATWQPWIEANQQAAPELVEEMQGIARGADVSFEHLFQVNSLLDVGNFRWIDCVQQLVGCTCFVVPHEAGTGQTLLGQTYDLSAFRRRFNILLRIQPDDGPAQLVYSLAGMVGLAGLNEHGLGININYLSSNDCQPGKLHAVIVRQVLAASNLADAVAAPTAGTRAGGSHYLVADDAGHVVSVETTAEAFALLYPDGKPYGHTNHYLSEWLQPRQVIRSTAIGSSIARYTALRRFLQRDDLDRKSLMTMTADHSSYPRSICAHGGPDEPEHLRGSTIAAMVQVLGERTMHICGGCACEGEYQAIALEG